MIGEVQKKTAQAIVNVYETGKVAGDYGAVTVIAGDSGHLTYGRSQCCLAGGNLYRLIDAYCTASGAAYGQALSPYLDRLKACDASLDQDAALRSLLKQAGGDPVMQAQQDRFFDQGYWLPALSSATQLGIVTALGVAVVYDSHIQGAWAPMRDRTSAAHGEPAKIGEKAWIGAYVATRRAWMADNSNAVLHNCVYRMDGFLALISAGNWDLSLPLTVHGVSIDAEALGLQTAAV